VSADMSAAVTAGGGDGGGAGGAAEVAGWEAVVSEALIGDVRITAAPRSAWCSSIDDGSSGAVVATTAAVAAVAAAVAAGWR
jgi:hypothetical protein